MNQSQLQYLKVTFGADNVRVIHGTIVVTVTATYKPVHRPYLSDVVFMTK